MSPPPSVPPAAPVCDPDLRATLQRLSEQAARIGGRVAHEHFGRDLQVRRKPDRSEVTIADEAAQVAVITCLNAARPADPILAEEQLDAVHSTPPPAAGVCWVVDPLDGTRNFVRRVPVFACSVAALLHGVPVAGAIYDPVADSMFTLDADRRVSVNGVPQPPLSAQNEPQVSGPLVGLPSKPKGEIARLAHACLDRFVCRNLGATALHLAWLACGRFDAMLADNARLWDIAAGWLLATAAGAVVTGPSGQPLFPTDVSGYAGEEIPLVAARPAFHSQLLAL